MGSKYEFAIVGNDQTKRMFKSINAGLGSVRRGINSTQVKMVALAGIAGMGFLIKQSLQVNDSLAKVADRTNSTTEGLAALRHQAELAGESQESLDRSLMRMRRGLGQAQQGMSQQIRAVEALGFGLEDVIGLKADEQFVKIGVAISELESRELQAAVASDIFGRSGIMLLNLFDQGEEGFANAAAEVEKYGLALSRVDAAMIEEANDEMVRAESALQGIGNRLTIQLAPIIGEVSRQFVEAATSGDNMAEVVDTGLRGVTDTVGVFADGIHGVQILLQGAQVVGIGFGTAFVGAIDLVQTAIFGFADLIKQSLIMPFKGWIEIAALGSDKAKAALESINNVLANEWKPPPGVSETLDQLTDGLVAARGELHQMMLQELPSALIDAKLGEVLRLAEARAEEIARKATASAAGGGVDGLTDEADEREKARTKARLDRLNASYFTELEALREKYAQEQVLLQEALDAKLITEQQYQDKNTRAAANFETQKRKLEKTGMGARLKMAVGSFGQLAGISGSQNKKMFAVQKASALAQASVALPAAVIESFKNAGGFPWGLVPAAAMAAAGAAQIAQIKSTSFGGGGYGGGGSFGGGAGGAPGLGPGAGIPDSVGLFDNNQSGQRLTLQVVGNVFTKDSTEFQDWIVETVQEFSNADGIIFQQNSAQALEIGG